MKKSIVVVSEHPSTFKPFGSKMRHFYILFIIGLFTSLATSLDTTQLQRQDLEKVFSIIHNPLSTLFIIRFIILRLELIN